MGNMNIWILLKEHVDKIIFLGLNHSTLYLLKCVIHGHFTLHFVLLGYQWKILEGL